MTSAAEFVLKTSLLVGVALVALSLSSRLSAAARHWLLAVTLTFAAFMPALEFSVPAWQLPLSFVSSEARRNAGTPVAAGAPRASASAVPSSTAGALPTTTIAGARSRTAASLVTLAWGTGTVLCLATLAFGLFRLRRLAREAAPIDSGLWRDTCDRIATARGLTRRVTLLAGRRDGLLVTWGTWRPKVMVPVNALAWPADCVSAVLSHELAHVERGDWLAQLAGEVVRCVHWFNPVIWIACTRLRRDSELACDDVVLRDGMNGADYAAHLVDLARQSAVTRRRWLPAPAIVGSSFEQRIVAMLNHDINRTPVSFRRRLATLAVLLVAAVGIASAQSSFATVSGVLHDQNGGTTPNARVVLRHLASDARYEVRSDATGMYEVSGLRSGDYAFEVILPGFTGYKEELTLSPGERLLRHATLTIGALEETINVLGGSGITARPVVRRLPPGTKVPALDPCTTPQPSGNIRPPVKLVDVRPLYPDNLRDARAEGVVELLATIDPRGKVSDVDVTSSPSIDMTTSAVEAVRQWEFSPTLLNCAPVPVMMTVHVNFSWQR